MECMATQDMGYIAQEYNMRVGITDALDRHHILIGIVEDILNAQNPEKEKILQYLDIGYRIVRRSYTITNGDIEWGKVYELYFANLKIDK
jgi:hypothetical protein